MPDGEDFGEDRRGQDGDRRRTHEAGFDHYLIEPADP
jgi:hypothetical protein